MLVQSLMLKEKNMLRLCPGDGSEKQRVITFLCDADGAAAHADSQSINTGIDQVLGLGCCDDCRWRNCKVKIVSHCVKTIISC